MDLMLTTTCCALVLISACSFLAVWSPRFEDTNIQRLCFAGMAIFSLGLAYEFWRTDYAADKVQIFIWLVAGYTAETTRKIRSKGE